MEKSFSGAVLGSYTGLLLFAFSYLGVRYIRNRYIGSKNNNDKDVTPLGKHISLPQINMSTHHIASASHNSLDLQHETIQDATKCLNVQNNNQERPTSATYTYTQQEGFANQKNEIDLSIPLEVEPSTTLITNNESGVSELFDVVLDNGVGNTLGLGDVTAGNDNQLLDNNHKQKINEQCNVYRSKLRQHNLREAREVLAEDTTVTYSKAIQKTHETPGVVHKHPKRDRALTYYNKREFMYNESALGISDNSKYGSYNIRP